MGLHGHIMVLVQSAFGKDEGVLEGQCPLEGKMGLRFAWWSNQAVPFVHAKFENVLDERLAFMKLGKTKL